MKPLRISEPASKELREAVRWYEERRPGLGAKLFDGVTNIIDIITAHPEIGESRAGKHSSRRLRVQGFPYYVAYRIREEDLYVVAIAHTSRRPGYWKDRQ